MRIENGHLACAVRDVGPARSVDVWRKDIIASVEDGSIATTEMWLGPRWPDFGRVEKIICRYSADHLEEAASRLSNSRMSSALDSRQILRHSSDGLIACWRYLRCRHYRDDEGTRPIWKMLGIAIGWPLMSTCMINTGRMRT